MPPGEAEPESKTGRGVSPVIGVILMVAIAVILAAVIGAFVLGFGEANTESTPVVDTEIDRGITDNSPPLEGGTRKITIRNRAGDAVPVSELRIATEAQCFDSSTGTTTTKRGEIHNLPASSGISGMGADNIEGDKIFSTRKGAVGGPIASGDNWEAGKPLVFHIDNDDCQILSESATDIQVLHEPSNSVIGEQSIGSGDVSLGSPADAEYDISLNTDDTDNFAFLNVTVVDGKFDPSLSELKMEVTVTDNAGNSVSEKEQIRKFDSIFPSSYTEIFENQNQVGPGDNTALDLVNGITGTGDIKGPLDEGAGDEPTTVTVSITFEGEEIASATLEATNFGSDGF